MNIFDTNDHIETVNKVCKLIPEMSMKDQLLLFTAYSHFIDVCDELLSKYDGRDERMLELITELWGDKNENG